MNTFAEESERLTAMMIRRQIAFTPTPVELFVFDDVIPCHAYYAAAARASAFRSVAVGPAWFHGIAEAMTGDEFSEWLSLKFPNAVSTLSFFRESPDGQVEPNFIHTDRDMGDWTAILYLNDRPYNSDGTIFWRDTKTGEVASVETNAHAEGERWNEPGRFEVATHVAAKFNRCVVFSSALFHSRALFDNYGTAGKDARLIQIVFGTGSLETS